MPTNLSCAPFRSFKFCWFSWQNIPRIWANTVTIKCKTANPRISPTASDVEITIKLLLAAMKDVEQHGTYNFLIDGFPRNLENYEGWFKTAGDATVCLGCIFMECPLDELTKRIMGRAEEARTRGEDVRRDDNLESLQKRFHTYKEQSLPIVSVFEEQGMEYHVEAAGSKDEVFSLFKAHIDSSLEKEK